jgi:hypothetical protein
VTRSSLGSHITTWKKNLIQQNFFCLRPHKRFTSGCYICCTKCICSKLEAQLQLWSNLSSVRISFEKLVYECICFMFGSLHWHQKHRLKSWKKVMSCYINENDYAKKTQIGKFTLCYCEFNFLYVVNNL